MQGYNWTEIKNIISPVFTHELFGFRSVNKKVNKSQNMFGALKL